MSALAIKQPTYGELRAQLAVMTAERNVLVRHKERSAALMEALRKIARKADNAITLETPSLKNADLQDVRRLALNAISDWKE